MNLNGKNLMLNLIPTKNIMRQIIKFMKVQETSETLILMCPYQQSIKNQMSHKI